MVALVARTGRQFQRYHNGHRLVVGCIPYRFKIDKPCTNGVIDKSCSSSVDQTVEVLVITSQKGHKILFPKGGWETDESMIEAVEREALEEAGVLGTVQCKLGKWSFKSKSQDKFHEGHMFPLLVTEQLDLWPEKDVRQRKWVTVVEARENCQYPWMKEALDEFVNRLSRANRIRTIYHRHISWWTTQKARTDGFTRREICALWMYIKHHFCCQTPFSVHEVRREESAACIIFFLVGLFMIFVLGI